MKLYNLYKSLILENVGNTIDQLVKGETTKDGRKAYRAARIWYRDKKTNTLEERYVFIYGVGTTKAGNKAIRAFQAYGGTQSGNSKWKIFLIDNITKIEVTDFRWYKPVDQVSGGSGIPKYKGPNQDNSFSNGLEKGVTF
jgi:hypothetical protein